MNGRLARLRLAWAYARHELRRRFRPVQPASADDVAITYGADRLVPLTPVERARLPAMSRCVSCGLCALVVKRVGHTRLPDLASAHLRDLTRLPLTAADLEGGEPGAHVLAAAAAVCPVGVPLDEVTAAVRRFSSSPG